MKPAYHATVSAILSGILYSVFRSWGLAIASFVSGILIDLDHIIDYVIEYGLSFDIKKFFRVCYKIQFRRLHLILHGWEWLIFWAVIAKLTDWNPWITGLLVGHSQHIVFDQIANKSSFGGYSLLWRWINRFDLKAVFPWKNHTDKSA